MASLRNGSATNPAKFSGKEGTVSAKDWKIAMITILAAQLTLNNNVIAVRELKNKQIITPFTMVETRDASLPTRMTV